jgi:uncharacterized DUF497 family protein
LNRFTWNPRKAKRNLRDHKISFEAARDVFYDPHAIFIEDCETAGGEMRYHAIGYAAGQFLAVVVYIDLSKGDEERLHYLGPQRPKHSRSDFMPNNVYPLPV